MNYCLNAWRTLEEMPFNIENKQYYSTRKSILEPSSHIRDLGVYLSDDCTWSYHINKMTVEARKIAAWVLGAFRDRSAVTMITLYKSLVRSKLEYCCPLWNPTKIGDIQLIENVQKQFTRKVKGMCDFDYWERLEKLKLLSLQRRRERYSIIHVWKMLNDKAPNNIGLKTYNSSRLGIKITIPKFNHQAQKSYSTAYDDSFGIKAARLWNLLPKSVNSHTSLDPFKVALCGFLNQFPDRPPVPGYTPPNSNSLLDWCAVGGNGVCA